MYIALTYNLFYFSALYYVYIAKTHYLGSRKT